MASEITEEEDENPSYIHYKEEHKVRIRQIIDYQKSLYHSSLSNSCSFSSSSSSSAAATSSGSSSARKSSSLMDLMREGSTSLGRLFDMEHTSLHDYFKEYSVSPVVKPILLWGSDTDDYDDDDPWKGVKQVNGGGSIFSLQGSLGGSDFVQDCERKKSQSRRLMRTKSYRILPRLGFWRCGRVRFRLRLFRKLRIMIKGRILL